MAEVAIVVGSRSDINHAERCQALLTRLGVDSTVHVASAHRTPDRLDTLIRDCGASVFIAMAGMSAALPGAVAARTVKPVIGVPLSGGLGLDSLLAVVQMPRGVPVAAVALDGAENAALLAVEILAVTRKDLLDNLLAYRATWKEEAGSHTK
jgi:5-(carboxyamino)imidazole ribonucleotide mutase